MIKCWISNFSRGAYDLLPCILWNAPGCSLTSVWRVRGDWGFDVHVTCTAKHESFHVSFARCLMMCTRQEDQNCLGPFQYPRKCLITRFYESLTFVFKIVWSLLHLSGIKAALPLRHLPNFGVIWNLLALILHLWDFQRSYDETSYQILKQALGFTKLVICFIDTFPR